MDSSIIKSIVQTPFVFISYATENVEIASVVYDYLRNHEINVLFDEGGLPTGTSLPEYEQYIIHSNCKKVFMIFDENYLRKINSQVGEVWQEYDLIRNHYRSHNKNKYVPILCDGFNKNDLPDLFKEHTVFGTLKDLDGIVNDCKAITISPSRVISDAEAKKILGIVDSLYDSGDYPLCLKYSSELLDAQVNARFLAQACSTILCVYLTDNIGYIDIVENAFNKLLSLLKKGSVKRDRNNYPRYLLNCSLMFQKREGFNTAFKNKSLDFATRSLEKAIAFGYSNIYYYECHCARVYETSGALNKANFHMNKARSILSKDYGGNNNKDTLTSWEIYLHGAKILIGLAEQCVNRNHDRTELINYLNEADVQLEYLKKHHDEMDICQAAEKELYETLSFYYQIKEKSVG